jgi:hypothetical protein
MFKATVLRNTIDGTTSTVVIRALSRYPSQIYQPNLKLGFHHRMPVSVHVQSQELQLHVKPVVVVVVMVIPMVMV